MLHFNLVPQKSPQSGESLQELGALRRLVSDELDIAAIILIVDGQPLRKTVWLVGLIDLLKNCSCILVLVEFRIGGLGGADEYGREVTILCVFEFDTDVLKILEADDPANCA